VKTLALVVVVVLAGCGHIPKADPTGVPPAWPAPSASVKSAPGTPLPSETPETPRPNEKPPNEKPVIPPLKREVLPPSTPPPQT
jgi:hypothetical protein